MTNETTKDRSRAESRRIKQAKFKLYSVLGRIPVTKLTPSEHAIMSVLDSDAEILEAVARAIREQRRKQKR